MHADDASTSPLVHSSFYKFVTLPDPDLKWNEARRHFDYGQIDWDEFWATVNGHGPCNKERLATRVKAHEQGQWVREAALAHAQKQQQRQHKEAA